MSRTMQDFTPRTSPLPHQREAIQYVLDNPLAAIFDEQGLGKTKIVIDAFAELMRRGDIDAALVVAPMSLVYNWEWEIRKHSHLIPVVLRGSRRQQKYRFLSGANFYLANYEAIVAQPDVFRKLVGSRRFAIALDEATRIKDPETETARTLLTISKKATRRVLMTGTPIANRPVDLWAQFFFLDRGQLLGRSFTAFASDYDPESEGVEERLEALSELIRAHSIRRLKADVLQLPEKSFHSHDVELRGEQRAIYDVCAEELLIELRSMSGEKYVREIDNVLERLLRLVQIASNPGLIDPLYSGPVAKLEYLADLADALLQKHDKLLIWSSFVANIETVVRQLARYEPFMIHGGVNIEDRAHIVETFQASDRHRVLVANPAAAREGLTLTRASAAVYIDRTFNLVDYLQSQDRIHRIGQENACGVHKLIAVGTVDEYVDAVIDFKQSIAEYVYRPNPAGKERVVDLRHSRDELLQLLGEARA